MPIKQKYSRVSHRSEVHTFEYEILYDTKRSLKHAKEKACESGACVSYSAKYPEIRAIIIKITAYVASPNFFTVIEILLGIYRNGHFAWMRRACRV